MASILEQIAAKNLQITNLQSSLPALIFSENEWRSQSNVVCDFRINSKQDACLADKKTKLAKANEVLAMINNINNQILALQGEVATLNAVQAAKDTATVNLSEDGKSLEAMVIESDAKAQAELVVANSKATAITTDATTAADSKKKTTYVILGVVVLVVIVVVIVVVKKIKSKKS